MRGGFTLTLLISLGLLVIGSEAAKKHRRQSLNDIDHDDEGADVDYGGASEVIITVYPVETSVKAGQEVSFECRARTSDGSEYPSVSWSKVGGELSPAAHESSGRLSISAATAADQGRYVCVAHHGGQTFEAHASLTVRTGTAGNGLASRGACMADEKACSNNECVKSDYVCDGEPDCRDRSDEQNCPSQRACEPNEFKCRNNRCVQKMWLCDGDDDCGDGSDELDCGSKARNGHCAGTEFACHDGSQCVPTSFHCDGTNDCRDGSDEVGCVQPTVVQPPQTNMEVPQGGQFQLTCKAVAVPAAYINWRLNWGPVCDPPRCIQSSEGGTGTLTVNNAQPVDQGAYTCEAINVRGRVLATPDCIVRIVNQPFPQPQPTAPPQIVNCDPRGSASPTPNQRGTCDCKPLVTGPSCNECRSGSYHLSPKAPQGCLKCFCFGVTDQCRSSSWFRTTESLLFDNNSEGITLSDIEERNVQDGPFTYEKAGFLTSNTQEGGRFWRMPQRFLGNKVTSYGGKMELTVESTGGYGESREPLVVLKGNQMILVHRPRESIRPDHSNKIVIETYEQNYEQVNGQPATREELLTVLADLDAFLIRASHAEQQTSTSLGDVSWQIAVPRDTGSEQALEVEQCSCPPGYVGTSCEDCAPGYERSGQGPYLGTCVPIRREPQVSCSAAGAISPRGSGGRCECKSYTTGPRCDQCTPNSFHLAPTNPHGCIPCFCSGITQQCQSTNMGRVTVELDYRMGEREQLELSTSDSHQPLSPQSRPFVSGRDISFDAFHEVQGQTLYWKLPPKFLGNKVTSYGGLLKYIFKYTGAGNDDRNADVIIRGNDITLHLNADRRPQPDVENTVEVKLFEDKFTRVDGNPATREHLLMALADLDAFLIKASYNDDCASSSLLYVSLEYADRPGGAQALEVEQCACPPGYVGTSCEDCAPGYSRTGGGLYLGLCAKCECNGHATSCNKEYGYCENCQHNTEGDNCERCKPGFVGDARRGTPHDCQPAQTRPPCQCHNHSPRGCDSFGRCLLCEHNTEGTHCERCKAGYYGDATKSTPFDCTPCPCPGSSDCFLDSQGQVSCRNCPAGLSGRLCNECAPGYTRNTQAGRQCVPIGRVGDDRIQFVERPEVHPHGSPPQPMVDPPHTTVTEGEAASFRCWVPNIPDCQITWHKEQVGGPLPHGVYQTGNALKIPKAKLSDAGNYICTAQNQFGMGRSPPARLDVTRRSKCRPPKTESCPFNQPVAPRVDPPEQTVTEGEPARFRCWVPGVTDVELNWSRLGGQPLPHGARQHEGILHIDQSRRGTHDGQYECTARVRNDPQGPMRAPPVLLRIEDRPQIRTEVPVKQAEREPLRPQVDPPEQTVKEGDPATFRCWVPGHDNVQIRWSLPNNAPLPSGVHEQGGVLSIPRVASHHQSMYLCTAFDPQTRQPFPAPPATLRVASSPAPQVDPVDQTVNEGDPAKIRCWVPGQPDAVLRWSRRDNGALPQGSSEDRGVLSIPSMRLADQGDFTCTATDPNGENPRRAPNARINVRQPQKIEPLVDPKEQTIPEGKPFKIRCWVPGHPNLEVSWRKVDGELNDDADETRGVITVEKALLSDGGNYICSANDPSTGEPVDSMPALVNVKPEEPVEGPFISPDEQTVPEKDSASIKCWVPGDDDADLTFFRVDGAPLPFGSSIDGGILSIPSAEKVDEGDYRCVYTRRDDDGEEIEKRNSTLSKLTVTSDNEPITVRVEPRVWNGKPGDKHQFKCIVTGNPVPTIQWSAPGGGPLPHDVTEMEDGILDFANGRAELNGDYTCTATNPVGSESDHGSVNIGNSLTVKTTPSGPRIIITVGEPLEVKCEAFGDPDPEVEWIHDPGPERGDLPDDYKPITISEQFIKHPSIGLFNAGVYTCKGSNSHATATKNIYIEVVEPSKVATISILGGSSQWFEEGEAGELTCTATGSHLIDRIEWVKVDDQLPTDVEEHNEPGLLHFSNFKKNYAGDYECRGFRNNELIASSRVSVNTGSSPTGKGEAKVSIEGPAVRVVNQGDTVELTCSVEGDHSGESFEWSLLHGGSLLRRLSSSPKLRIESIDPEKDYGVYRCHVEDESGIVVGSAFTAVSVGFSKDHSVTLKFDDKSDADLLCPVYSVPGSKVVWEKDGGEVPAAATPNGGKLHISPFDETVSGLYSCRVTIGDEDVTGYVQAQIFVPDTIIQVVLEASSESVNVGDRVWFDCKVTGDPDAQVEWVREEEDELPPSAQVTASRLIFAEVAESDGGVYKCIARTKAGPLEARSVLNVGGKRKRKRNQRRRARHNRRHAPKPSPTTHHSLFGSLFSSSS